MIKAIACDLDGTLLDSQSNIRPDSARALKTLQDHGFMVVLASGRSWRSVLRIQSLIGLTGPVITHNGAYGYDSLAHDAWYRRGIPKERAREFVAWADAHEVMVRLYLGQGQPVVYNRYDLAHQLCWLRPEDRIVTRLADTLDTDPLEVFLTGWEAIDQFIAQFGFRGPDYELLVFPHVGYREANIAAPGINKVEALNQLSRAWNIRPNEVLAIGDGPNDAAMLAWAGVSIAVGDGSPQLVPLADYITAAGSPEPVLEGLQWAFPYDLTTPVSTA